MMASFNQAMNEDARFSPQPRNPALYLDRETGSWIGVRGRGAPHFSDSNTIPFRA
jgi:hypothetical protein